MASIESYIFAGEGFRSNAIPDRRILSSKARLKVQTQNMGVGSEGGKEIDLGEIMSFEYEEVFEVVKEWFPYGFKTKKKLVKPGGWNLTFNAEKVNWKMAYWVYANERAQLGTDINPFAAESNTFGGKEVMGHQVYFSVDYIVTYEDDFEERYTFKDVTILNFQGKVPENNEPVTETIIAWSPERLISDDTADDHKITKINDVVSSVLETMKKINKS